MAVSKSRRSDWRAATLGAFITAIGGLLAAAHAQTYTPPRLADGKTPDFRGVWQAVEQKAGVDLESAGVIVSPASGKIPYKPEARAMQRANYKNRLQADPLRKCFQAGVPRATYSAMPMQIVQGEGGNIAIVYQENHAFRYFYPDSRPPFLDIDSWMGDDRYRWDGDVFVASNRSQAATWLDEAGNHHTNQMHVVERYTMTDANTIAYDATIEDPDVFTQPWALHLTLKRKTGPLVEDECIPDHNGVRYHVDPYKPDALLKNTDRRWTLIPETK